MPKPLKKKKLKMPKRKLGNNTNPLKKNKLKMPKRY